jgi:hypothetical protein
LFSPSVSIHGQYSALIDSGSSDCFIDSTFINNYRLSTYSVPPLQLRLFDGTTNNMITQAIDLPVRFATGVVTPTTFYVTPLDGSCAIVLGYNWLARYNPLIDWVSSSITFQTPAQPVLTPLSSADMAPVSPPPASTPHSDHDPPSTSDRQVPSIEFVSPAAFAKACRLEGSVAFSLSTPLPPSQLRASTSTTSEPTDLAGVPTAYHEYADVFSKSKANILAPHREHDLRIDLEEGTHPPLGTIYSLSPTELEALRAFLDEHLASGFIRPSSSAHAAPVLFVRKKDGSLRLCVDFRGLNKITRKDRYPLPRISDLLDAPSQANIYTKLDLRHAYHLVRIAQGDEWKTAFRTRYGSYEWLVMPFGLSNAPAAFQRFINTVFADLLDNGVVVYLDDILIYSEDVASHEKLVLEVLRRLRLHSLYTNSQKCEFHTETTEYLGYILSPSGLAMSTEKVKAIQEWPEPRKVKDIQSFLGFANFYRRFIHEYSEIVLPLTRLTRKGAPWVFDEKCRAAFTCLKDAFTSAPILTHWVPDVPIIVETDASDYAISGIISIRCEDEEIRPVAFRSRTLTAPELNYDTHDKELLAIYEAFGSWRHYLEGSGTPVDVVTDHKNLEYFCTTKLLTRRQARWSEYLSGFNMVVRFRPGKLGAKPDALTRRWDVYPKEGDKDYARVNPQNFRPVFTQEQLASSLRATYLATPVLRASLLIDTESLHKDIIVALPSDPAVAQHLSNPIPAESRWSLGADGLLRLDKRIYVPDHGDLRLRVLRFKHDHPLSGHFGQNRTLDLVRREYTWPGIRTFVRDYVSSCTSCARSKVPRHKPYGLLKQLPIPERPWNSISMDFIEQLPPSAGYTAVLVVVDRLSKQCVFIPTHDTVTAPELAKLFLLNVFSKHGVPSHITSDRGSEFVSHFFRSLGTALDIRLHFTSGYHPEGDGQTERMNQTLEQYLRVYCNYQQDNWADLLPLAEFAYNNAPNATTGVSPFFANKGYHPNISVHPERDLSSARAHEYAVDLDSLHHFLREEMGHAQKRYQGPADARRLPAPAFEVGTWVFVKAKYFRTTRPSKKLSEKNLGPFEIIAQPGSHSRTLRLPEAMRAVHPVFHVSQLEPSIPNAIPNRVQTPPPPVEIDGEPEFEIAEILDSKFDRRRRNCKLLYLVRWLGYEGTEDETSWLLATELAHASELLSDFHSRYPARPGPSHA